MKQVLISAWTSYIQYKQEDAKCGKTWIPTTIIVTFTVTFVSFS